jgi:Uma2 family endonuclease
MSDMRLHVAAANSYLYPDVLVTCSALDLASPMVKTEPKLIIEVLSPSTTATPEDVVRLGTHTGVALAGVLAG